jgi:hypothetical protein
MVAVPAATAVTVPPDTVATEGALLLHVTFLFVALEGATVAVNVSELPTVRLVDVLLSVTPVTATGLTLLPVMLTVQVAVLLPSAVVTVMVTVPVATAVTIPPDTVATEGALLVHVTFLFVALEGAMVAVNVSVLPTVIVVDDLFRDTPVTSTGGGAVTVTVHAAVLLPLVVVTVITALPTDTPITTPFVTVATAVLLLLHVTF